MGVLGTSTQLPGGDLFSVILGRLGALNVKTDLLGARVESGGVAPSIGNIFIGGDLVGGNDPDIGAGIRAFGTMGNVTIGGSLVGGATDSDGRIYATTSIGKVTIGGSMLGGAGPSSGSISSGGSIGAVAIKGDLAGGGAALAGFIHSDGDIASVTLGGSLLGGTVADLTGDEFSGSIQASGSIPGGVKIGGDVVGGNGPNSGIIEAGGRLGAVSIRGSVSGVVNGSGLIVGLDGIASVKIGGDLRSAPFLPGTGRIFSSGPVGAVAIGGSVVSGAISGSTLGAVTIGGDLRSEDTGDLVTIAAVGVADSAAPAIKSVTVKGSVVNAYLAAGIGLALNPDASIGTGESRRRLGRLDPHGGRRSGRRFPLWHRRRREVFRRQRGPDFLESREHHDRRLRGGHRRAGQRSDAGSVRLCG